MTANPARPKTFRLAAASVVGTTLEFYEFSIYGTMAALVFGQVFFPSYNPVAATLASFATFAVGFFARPLGSVIFGHLGDKLGRRSTLILSLTIMGGATFLMGCLPTEPQIGWLAPALLVLLRLVQGVSLGGEWAGASLMLVESAPAHRRGFLGSLPQVGAPAGLLLGTAAVNISMAVSGDAFVEWGWRLPFLFSAVLFVVALVIRFSVDESPAFKEIAAEARTDSAPVARVFRLHWREILLAAGIVAPAAVLYYVATTYSLSYGTAVLGLESSVILNAVLLTCAIYLFSLPLVSLLSDKVGQNVVIIGGCMMAIPAGFAVFASLMTGNTLVIFAVMGVFLAIGHAAIQGPQAALFAKKFDVRVRYSGVAIGQALSVSIMGGLAPFLATLFFEWSGGTWLICVWMGAWAIVGILCARTLHRRPTAPDMVVMRPSATDPVDALKVK